MATTTPNFGWPVPTSTDLVKNGATAIEGLGDAIDASLLDLKGGTTGQVLAKATNTDMDFTWTTPSTAAGYADNAVLNSGFNVWQRGTSIVGSAGSYLYTADRWQTNASTALTVSRQATGDTTNLPFIQYCARVQRNSGSTATAAAVLSQSFETVNSIPYAGKAVTISFYARRGANFSGASNQLEVYLASGTGTDQNAFVGGFTGATNVVYQTPTLTTTWQRFSYTATVGTTATQLATQFTYTPSGTAGAADFYEVTGVQLEAGSSATAYHPNGSTYEEELAACQRYYWRSSQNDVYSHHGLGIIKGGTSAMIDIKLPVTMRVRPTSIDFSTVGAYDSSTIFAATSIGFQNNQSSADVTCLDVVFSGGGGTQFRPAFLINNNSTSGYIGLNAEL